MAVKTKIASDLFRQKWFRELKPELKLLWLYLTTCIMLHITISKPDLEGAADGLVSIISTVLILCLLLGWFGCWEDKIIRWQWDFFCNIFPLILLMVCILGGAVLLIRRR